MKRLWSLVFLVATSCGPSAAQLDEIKALFARTEEQAQARDQRFAIATRSSGKFDPS